MTFAAFIIAILFVLGCIFFFGGLLIDLFESEETKRERKRQERERYKKR